MIEGFAREMPEDRMAEAIVDGPRVHPPDLRDAGRAGREGRASQKKPSTRSPEPTGCSTRCKEKYYDAFREAKQTEGKLARAEACDALKERAVAEMIPDPAAEGAIDAEALRLGLARPGEPRRSAT